MRKKLNKIPIISVLFRISNAYVYKGDPVHFVKTAPIGMWVERIGKSILFSIALGFIISISS